MASLAQEIQAFRAIRSASTARIAATTAVMACVLGAVPACHAHVESHALLRAEAYEQPYRPIAAAPDDTDPICLGTFEGVLAPYGAWVEDDEVGYVWVPEPTVVGVGFVPYLSAGHWSYTDHGYFWVSDHSWGWATFHYGRWVQSARWGWVWVPGARYSPAWVEWRHGGGWLGWAPTRPSFRWHAGVATYVEAPPAPYVFVHSSAFFSPYLTVVVAHPAHRPALMSTTTRWIAPPVHPDFAGAHPFLGPDPVVAGIPKGEVVHASAPVPTHVLPHAVPWGKSATPPIAPKPFGAPVAPKVGPPKEITPLPPELAPKPPPVVAPKPPVFKPKPTSPEIVPLPPPKAPPPAAPTKPKVKPKPVPMKPTPFS